MVLKVNFVEEYGQKAQLVFFLDGVAAGVVGHIGEGKDVFVVGEVDHVYAEFVADFGAVPAEGNLGVQSKIGAKLQRIDCSVNEDDFLFIG